MILSIFIIGHSSVLLDSHLLMLAWYFKTLMKACLQTCQKQVAYAYEIMLCKQVFSKNGLPQG